MNLIFRILSSKPILNLPDSWIFQDIVKCPLRKSTLLSMKSAKSKTQPSLPLSQTVTSLFSYKISTWIWTVHSLHYPMYVLNIMLMKCPKRHWESPKKKIQKTQRRTHKIVNDRWKDPIKGLIKFWRTECFVWECSGSYNSNMIQIPINFLMTRIRAVKMQSKTTMVMCHRVQRFTNVIVGWVQELSLC